MPEVLYFSHDDRGVSSRGNRPDDVHRDGSRCVEIDRPDDVPWALLSYFEHGTRDDDNESESLLRQLNAVVCLDPLHALQLASILKFIKVHLVSRGREGGGLVLLWMMGLLLLVNVVVPRGIEGR